MRLLQINTVVNSGSTGRIAEEIGQLAIIYGWESYIAYGRNERPSKSHLIKVGTDCEIKWHGVETRLFDRHGLGSKQATLRLIKQIESINPDIIHLHNIHGYYLNIAILFNFLKSYNKPIVWTLHDCWSFTGHCTHFDFVSCEKWKQQCFKCPQKREYPSSFFCDRSYQNYNLKKQLFSSISNLTLICVSKWLGLILKDSILSEYSSQVIYNGVDVNIFSPSINSKLKEKFGLGGKKILLGVASVWTSRKGLNDFIKLSRLLKHNFQIVLVGLTKEQKRKLPDKIIGIERTENVKQLAEIYSIADLFINPTYEDNFPTTNLEALACGTPVLTYRTGGSVEAISSDTGFVVEKGDINGVLEAISIIEQNGKAYYSEKCRERVIQNYNKDDRFAEYFDLYEKILKTNSYVNI